MPERRLYPKLELFNLDPIRFYHEEGTCILGLALGSAKYQDEFFSHLVEECGKLLQLLPSLEDAQVAFELMRACFSVTRVMHAMRGVSAENIVEATTLLDDKVREVFCRIFHFDVDDGMWNELTLHIKGRDGDAKNATLGVGLASSAYLAALIDATDLREQLLLNANIGDAVRSGIEATIRKACEAWADDSNTSATSIEGVLKACALKQKPDPAKTPAKTQARLSEMVISNRISAVQARVPKLANDYSRVDILRSRISEQREKQWLICSISNTARQRSITVTSAQEWVIIAPNPGW